MTLLLSKSFASRLKDKRNYFPLKLDIILVMNIKPNQFLTKIKILVNFSS